MVSRVCVNIYPYIRLAESGIIMHLHPIDFVCIVGTIDGQNMDRWHSAKNLLPTCILLLELHQHFRSNSSHYDNTAGQDFFVPFIILLILIATSFGACNCSLITVDTTTLIL